MHYVIPDSAKFKGIKTVKNHDDTVFYVCFGVIENFTHQVKLQAVIILPINNVISMRFSHFCQLNFADSGDIYNNLDRELVLCGAALHDIGKLWKYETSATERRHIL